jgi:putative transposase
VKTSRFSDSKIVAILKQAEAGTPVPELCREHGISSATFYKWRSKYGGMDASLMARLKGLDDENRRLKKMYAEERLKADIFKEALEKKGLTPSCRREMAQLMIPDCINAVWSVDFMHDQLADGRAFRLLNVIDDFTRVRP